MTRARRLVWLGIAFTVAGLAAGSVFGRVVRGGFDRVILTEVGPGPSSLELLFGEVESAGDARARWRAMLEADHRFTVWATGRNAFTLLHSPLSVFDAESCHPAARALAFGHPLITFGLLGLPAALVSGDPVIAYNLVTILLPWLAAVAMYLLIVEWTGVPAAGITAGLLYGFHASKLENVFHPFAEDTGWTVLGMLFLARYFARGRTRDGLGAAIAYALQVGSSLYAVVTSICVSLPFVLFLLWRERGRAIRPLSGLVSFGVFAVLAAAVLAPYAAFLSRANDGVRERLYGSWDAIGGSGTGFIVICGLALAGLVVKNDERCPRGTAWVLAGIALFCALIATGGNVNARLVAVAAGRDAPFALPNLYEALASVLPGIETVRAVGFTDAGTHLSLCALAGLGAAGLVNKASGRARGVASVVLVALAWISALGAPWLGIASPVAFDTFVVRPPESTLAFYQVLDRRANTGPILELPTPSGFHSVDRNAKRQLVSAYHKRRTSSCYNSYTPPEVEEVAALAARLPALDALDALDALARLGFTTIVVHHNEGQSDAGWKVQQSLETLTRGAGRALREIHATPSMTAYAFERSAP